MGEAGVYTEDLGMKNLQIKAYMRKLMASNHNERCLCCPYGYHVDLDFVDFAKDVTESHSELHKIRRYQRRLERAQTTLANGRGSLAGRIKEALSATTHVEFISPNNSNVKNQETTDQMMKTKSENNDVIYISNNADDSNSRSSDECIIQSPSSTQNSLSNSKYINIFSDVSLPEDNYKKSLANKSFVVSYEHLMSIREQMSSSLKRVQELEKDAKISLELQQQLEKITHEKQELQRQLSQKIKDNIPYKSKADVYHQMISEAFLWKSTTDVPPELLPNLERIFQVKSSSMSESPLPRKILTSKYTQTEIKGNLIVDTLSYLTNSTCDISTQPQPKVQRRNFGVTVRPNHQHFTQQISFSTAKSFKTDESLITLNNFITTTEEDIDKKVGTLLHNTLGFIYKNSYHEAVNLLKQELLSSVMYKSWQAQQCQTKTKKLLDNATQVTSCEYYHNKGVQINPIQWNKYSNTREFITKDSSIETEKVTLNNSTVQTIHNVITHNTMQTEFQAPMVDFTCQCRYNTEMNNISSNTDQNLIDDLISEYIEKAMNIIQQELKIEYESKLHEKPLLHSLETNESDSEYCQISADIVIENHTQMTKDDISNDKVTSISETPKNLISEGCHLDIAVKNICLEHSTQIVDSIVSGNVSERLNNHLTRSKMNYLDFTSEKSEDYAKLVNRSGTFELQVDTELRNESVAVEEIISDLSDSAGSSPGEGCYYTADRRIDYRNINQINEEDEEDNAVSVTETEKRIAINTEKLLMINSNTIKQDGDTLTEERFPEDIKTACNLVTIWMNDSTTTCSKDLNESLTAIRLFWFGLTRGNDTNLKFYLEKFGNFNTTLKERIINMTDPNGNSCLHYAVSEGRWSIVRQILETEEADVNKTNKAGYTVLMLAAVSDILDETILKLLISSSEVDKQSTNDAQQTALMLAASQGKNQLVQWLLEAGSSVNITDSDGSTALMCACDNGHLEVVRLFLSRSDTDTELEDKAGSNAMKIALDNSHKDIALLIFARNNLHKGFVRSKRRSGSSSHPTSPLNQRKFK